MGLSANAHVNGLTAFLTRFVKTLNLITTDPLLTTLPMGVAGHCCVGRGVVISDLFTNIITIKLYTPCSTATVVSDSEM